MVVLMLLTVSDTAGVIVKSSLDHEVIRVEEDITCE